MGLFTGMPTGKEAYAGIAEGAKWLYDKNQDINPLTMEELPALDKVAREAGVYKDQLTAAAADSLVDDQRWRDSEIGGAELTLRHAGRTGEALGGAYGAVINTVVPDWITKATGDLMNETAQTGLNTDIAQQGLTWLRDNPRVARDLAAGVGILELGLPKALLEPVRRALSAAANYIPNHYTPSIKNLKDMPKDYQYLAQRLLAFNVKGVKTYKEAFHLAQKLTGAGKWAKDGFVGGVNSILNPRARALYDKHGINSTSQEIVKKERALAAQATKEGKHAIAARHKEKAVAQINYNKYITAQTAHTGTIAKVMDDVLESVSYGGIQQLTKQNYINSAKKQQSTLTTRGSRGKVVKSNLEASEADLSFAYDQAQKIWGMSAKDGNKLVVKRNTGVGGNHNSDAIKNKNKVHRYVKKLFETDGISDPMEIYNHLKSLSKEDFPAGVVMLNKSAEDVALNGLWLSSSHVGSAVVEGGINVMTKIMPNQRAMSFVSDVHDFLEKVPVLGKVLGKALPNGEMSITPPIYVDLRAADVKKATKNRAGQTTSLNPNQSGQVSDTMIDEYINARPSMLSIVKQIAVDMPLQGLVLGNGLFDYDKNRPVDQPSVRQQLEPRTRAR